MKRIAVLYAILAAFCYGVSSPIAKILLANMPPVLMASMLYLGAGVGMLLIYLLRSKQNRKKEAPMTKKEMPLCIAMVSLDIAAPIFLMIGLSKTTSATASLLGNFEIVATTIVAAIAFKEAVGKRMLLAITLITVGSGILSVGDMTISLTWGSTFVLLACICWGIENNCTSKLSLKDPLQIVVIKGIGSSVVSFGIAWAIGERLSSVGFIFPALLLGFVSYGLSIHFYILAQRSLGASRTSAFYALAPFIGVIVALTILREAPPLSFFVALGIMLIGAYLAAFEKHNHAHTHMVVEHIHRHRHDDAHHGHVHTPPFEGEHSHSHVHKEIRHTHSHTPDLHHVHTH
jgi:drug/metabolite transporter (DMT)-like permease